ncbi:helix-turn-helix domain-containing protein [Streptomyces sp. NPDC093093]|uniref:helix-turn-helix domain-containing protein n=1 Tax=Streptomyces sp. NPDC093093 TaxID=3366025 RepID=UPI00381DE7AC
MTAITHRTGEQQADVAAALGLTQSQISRRQRGLASWTLADCDRLAAHWGMPVLDLLAGPTHALTRLPADRVAAGGTQTLLPLDIPAPAQVEPGPVEPAPTPVEPAPVEPSPVEPAPVEAARSAPGRSAPAAEPAPATTAPRRAPVPAPAAAAPPVPKRVAAPAGPLADRVRVRVDHELSVQGGDRDAARAALVKTAVPDVMALFAASRVGGRYEHSEFPPTADILKKASQKGADQIWEGRPKWRAEELHRAARAGHVQLDVTALDMNAAYLAALKTWLPIGKLVHSEGAEHNPKRSGVHRVTPAVWEMGLIRFDGHRRSGAWAPEG